MAIVDAVSRLLFCQLRITRTLEMSPRFVRIELADERFPTAPSIGDKIQIKLGLASFRTYTPYDYDPDRGSFALLVYLHGNEPGTQWARAAKAGDGVWALGPRRSLALSDRAPTVLFGDETSFALARATSAAAVLEVTDRDASAHVLAGLGVTCELVQCLPGDHHLQEVRDRLAVHRDKRLVLTGKAQSIQALRTAFRAQPGPFTGNKNKAYWSVGKRGLD